MAKKYIADLHLFRNHIKTSPDQRGFETIEEMHEYIIKQWNSCTSSSDTVYILGDFSNGKWPQTKEILKRLNGRKVLVTGNHDKYLHDARYKEGYLKVVGPYKETREDKERLVVMSHYPIMCYNKQYRRDTSGNPRVYMLYGHVHNSEDELFINEYVQKIKNKKRKLINHKGEVEERDVPCNLINCFCMFSDYKPLTLDEWIDLDEKRRNSNCLACPVM